MDLRCIASIPSIACRCSQREPERSGPWRRPGRVRRHRPAALECSGDGPRVGADRGGPLRNRCRAAAAPGRRGAQPDGGPAPAAPAVAAAPVVAARHGRRAWRFCHPRGRAAHRAADDRADAGRVVAAVQRGHRPALVGPPAALDRMGRGPGRHRRHRLVRRAGPAREGRPGRARPCRAGRRLPGRLRDAARRGRPGRRRRPPRGLAGRGRRLGRRRDSRRNHGVLARRRRRADRRRRFLGDLRADAGRPVLAAADADRLPGGPADDHPARHRRGHPGGLPGRGQPPARRVGPARRPERRHRRPGGAGRAGRTRAARPAGDPASGRHAAGDVTGPRPGRARPPAGRGTGRPASGTRGSGWPRPSCPTGTTGPRSRGCAGRPRPARRPSAR